MESELLAGSPGDETDWNPSGNGDSGNIPTIDEKDNNLGGEGSEISGAKNNGWSFDWQ